MTLPSQPRRECLGFREKRNAERWGSVRSARLARLLVVLIVAVGLTTPSPVAASSHDDALFDNTELPDRGIRPEEGEVHRLYLAVFGRRPDAGGFDFWMVKRLDGWTLDRVAAHFIDSPEYRARFGAPTDEGFVDLLYRNVLSRRPDAGGRMFWLDQLARGMDRRRVVVLFAESPEFVDSSNTVPQPPAVGRPPFSVRISDVSTEDLGASWQRGCPVGPAQLVHLDLTHVDGSGRVVTGRLTVHRDVADDVIAIFAELYRRRVPITSVRPAAEFGADDDAMMAANNTSGFNCRAVVNGTGWSRHAYGRAVDINPLVNPYVRGEQVLPPAGAPWVDRRRYQPGMLYSGGSVIELVRALGWRWGGDWTSLQDYQHIDIAGP